MPAPIVAAVGAKLGSALVGEVKSAIKGLFSPTGPPPLKVFTGSVKQSIGSNHPLYGRADKSLMVLALSRGSVIQAQKEYYGADNVKQIGNVSTVVVPGSQAAGTLPGMQLAGESATADIAPAASPVSPAMWLLAAGALLVVIMVARK